MATAVRAAPAARLAPPAPGEGGTDLSPGSLDAALHGALHGALVLGLAVLDAHCHTGARALEALADLGDIELPPGGAATLDPSLLAPLGPLYLVHELDAAGFLRTAELMAGLFASGAVHVPLGEAGGRIAAFWHDRRDRLEAGERRQLLEQVYPADAFYPAMQGLCAALVALADNVSARGHRLDDVREEVAMQQAASRLLDLMSAHAGGMVPYAARGLLDAIQAATRFMRERAVQVAFGASDLWGLVATTGLAEGLTAAQVREHVELGRAGAVVIGWLATASGAPRLDVRSAHGQTLLASAQRWLLARHALQAMRRRSAPAAPAEEAQA